MDSMVYVTGDTHADFTRFTSSEARRLRRGDTLIVLGDFGFLWNGGKKERQTLKKLAKLPFTVAFLDGPHENFGLLRDCPVSEWNGGRAQAVEGPVMRLLRGEIYTIEDETYFVFGGGESSDHDMRVRGVSWWEEEMPSEEEMRGGLSRLEQAGNKVDYVLTHEFPGGLGGYLGARGARLGGLNIYLGHVESLIAYRRWFFGSLHVDKVMGKRLTAVFTRILPVREPKPKGKHFK